MLKAKMLCSVATFLAFAAAGGVVPLDGEWRLDYFLQPDAGAVRTLPVPKPLGSITATVPGNCELDLQRAGLLPKMEIGTNCWIRSFEGNQYLYTKAFVPSATPAGGKAELVFDGVDTLADIFLNGEKIGESDNMFIAHRFDVTKQIRAGSNVVQVLLRSDMMESQKYRLGTIGHEKLVPGGAEMETLRKPAHAIGWDIMPRLMARGLWSSVRFETSGFVRICDPAWFPVRKRGEWGDADLQVQLSAIFRVEAPFSALDHDRIRVSLMREGRTEFSREHVLRHFQPVENFWVKKPALWWPKGSGDQPLYDAQIEILSPDGRLLARDSRKIGIKYIEFERSNWKSPDEPGEFLFRVNGEKIYIRGVNWTPLDAYHGRDGQFLDRTLALVDDLNCNMIRIWGGGVYESDAFYDYCDRKGILVWQDFMTAGSMMPQDDDYAARTRREAIEVVCRLRNHASLAVWCANNETDNAVWEGRGEIAKLDPNRDRNSRRTLADVCFEFDSSHPYIPGASYFDEEVVAGKARPSEGHIWGDRLYYKVPYYTNNVVRFAAELGYHGCPSRSSLEKMMPADMVYPWKQGSFDWNPAWRCKGTCPYDDPEDSLYGRNDIMLRQTRLMFGQTPTDLDAFIEASQIVQAEAMKTFVELFRTRKFDGMNGFIFWNMRDGWPIISDSVVDYYFEKKPAYYAIKAVHGDVLVTVRDDHSVWAVNDLRRSVSGKVRISDFESGRVLMERDFAVAANGRARLGEVPFVGQGMLLLAYEADGKKANNHFLYGAPPFNLDNVMRWLRHGCYPLGGTVANPVVVETAEGYNSWPMIQSLGSKLVCAYRMGKVHEPDERGCGTFARVSEDGGATWGKRITITNDPKCGETAIAKGQDASGAALFWVRSYGPKPLFNLYRTTDGEHFDLISQPRLDQGPWMQITDVFSVPTVGLMSFWFGGSSDDGKPRRWGITTSKNNGTNWTFRVIGENMPCARWPTEPSGVYLGNGRILGIARTEGNGPQLQVTSVDFGKTWKVEETNIRDVLKSTPSLVWDSKTDMVSNYYYQRGSGILRRRVAKATDVFDRPTAWPESEAIVVDHGEGYDAGNVNATVSDGRHFVTWYTGCNSKCTVVVLPID